MAKLARSPVIVPIPTPLRRVHDARRVLAAIQADTARIPRRGPHRAPAFRSLLARLDVAIAEIRSLGDGQGYRIDGYAGLVLWAREMRDELVERMPVPRNVLTFPSGAVAR